MACTSIPRKRSHPCPAREYRLQVRLSWNVLECLGMSWNILAIVNVFLTSFKTHLPQALIRHPKSQTIQGTSKPQDLPQQIESRTMSHCTKEPHPAARSRASGHTFTPFIQHPTAAVQSRLVLNYNSLRTSSNQLLQKVIQTCQNCRNHWSLSLSTA